MTVAPGQVGDKRRPHPCGRGGAFAGSPFDRIALEGRAPCNQAVELGQIAAVEGGKKAEDGGSRSSRPAGVVRLGGQALRLSRRRNANRDGGEYEGERDEAPPPHCATSVRPRRSMRFPARR
jgi:hypothetical protein